MENENPTCGRAISLEDPSKLSLGAEEFVVLPLDIEKAEIEVWPIRVERDCKRKIYFDTVYPSLVEWYEALRVASR